MNPVRILIVEDEPDTLDMLDASFRSRGYETMPVGRLSEALECVGRQQFDIIISDIAMPEVDGLRIDAGPSHATRFCDYTGDSSDGLCVANRRQSRYFSGL